MKTVRRPPYPKWNPGYFPCSSLTPLPISSRRPSVSFGGFGLRAAVNNETMTLALEWARDTKELGFAEEFSISPTSLEDVYVQMIGRPDALGADEPT